MHRQDVLGARSVVELRSSGVVDVPTKRRVAAFVMADPLAVEPEVGSAVDSVEVEIHELALGRRVDLERLAVPAHATTCLLIGKVQK